MKRTPSARDGGKSKKKVVKPSRARARAIARELELADALGPDGLTVRQKKFVEAYLGPCRLNATAAAKAAGYSPTSVASLRVQGCRLLMNANVQSRVRARLAGMGLDRELILERIGELAGSSMADLLDVTPDGRDVVLSLAKAARAGALGTIREYTQESDGRGIVTRKVRTHDPGKYLELLARYTGIIGDEGSVDPKSLQDDPANWPVERVREFCQEHGWALPDALAPRPAAVGSGLVDEKGQAIVRQTILESQGEKKTEIGKEGKA